MKLNNKTLLLIFSIVSAIFMMLYISNKSSEKNFDELAQGDTIITIVDMLDGKQINYQNFTVDKKPTKLLFESEKYFMFSFGNSQSYSLNSYAVGKDHLFIYYVAKKFSKYNINNLSASNVNFRRNFI